MTPAALDTAWMRALARGETPDAASLRAHLQAVHHHAPGFTEACAGRCRDPEGRTSYDWLVAAAPEGDVLDLACGSGALLDRLRRAHGAAVRLTGVDMSADELALAAERLPGGAARLHRGLAQAMPEIADDSQDAVLCHWALTLMDPLAPVLAEVARILRPGGVFAALVDGPHHCADGYTETNDLIYGHARRRLPMLDHIDLGDVRARDADTLAVLAAEHFPQAEITVEHAAVSMADAPETLAREAAGFFYAAFLLEDADRRAMLDELARQFATMPNPRFSMPVSRIMVRMAA